MIVDIAVDAARRACAGLGDATLGLLDLAQLRRREHVAFARAVLCTLLARRPWRLDRALACSAASAIVLYCTVQREKTAQNDAIARRCCSTAVYRLYVAVHMGSSMGGRRPLR
jgi:hypothetical protein